MSTLKPGVERALVSGGGIGGLCAAIALRQKGIAVDLVEKQAEWSVLGSGIIHQANAVRAEDALGVADRVIEAGFPFSGVRVRSKSGEVVADVPGSRLLNDRYPSDVGISRVKLRDILIDRAKELFTNLRPGLAAAFVSQDDEGAEVEFSNGETARYDLVVAADGIYSTMRRALFGDAYEPVFTGQGAWRYNLPRPAHIDRLNVFTGESGGNAGLMPISDELMYVFCTSTEKGNPRFDRAELAQLMCERLSGFSGEIGDYRDSQITDPSKVLYRPFEVVPLPAPWYRGRVVLIGDAAHATTAHLGQGAAMAMEDAVVLAEEVGGSADVNDALARWMDRRYERCAWIANTSLALSKFEQDRVGDVDMMALMRQMREMIAQPY